MSVGKASIKRALGAKDTAAAPAEEIKAPAKAETPAKKVAPKKAPAKKKAEPKKVTAPKAKEEKTAVAAAPKAVSVGNDLPYYLL